MHDKAIKPGNNMPIQAPLIPDPLVPYECKDNKTLFAVCRGDKDQIKRYLDPTPFEFRSDIFVVSISDFTNCKKLSFMDCAIILPVKYKEISGGYYMFEYEDQDYAIAAGRDLWGYPKKYAKIFLDQTDKKIHGEAIRNGEKIVEIDCDFSKPIEELVEPKITPHLNLHVMPRPDGPGILSMKVISRDTSPDFRLKYKEIGEAKVKFRSISTDPLNDLIPKSVLGGGLTVGDFLASDENGWGKILDILI